MNAQTIAENLALEIANIESIAYVMQNDRVIECGFKTVKFTIIARGDNTVNIVTMFCEHNDVDTRFHKRIDDVTVTQAAAIIERTALSYELKDILARVS